jgi:hypothetical protein
MFRAASVAAAVALLAAEAWAAQAASQTANSAPVPEVPALLAEVQKNQKALDALVEQYACRKKVEELEPAKSGDFRTKSVKEFEVFYLGGREVDRLVAKDSRPLAPDEQQAENARVERKVKELLHKQEKQSEREARGEKKKDDEPGISMFLRVERFSNPRRVDFRGQNVVSFDFEGNPEYRPKTRLESLVQKLVGRMWVDDQAKEIVKLDARFANSMKIGGGILASIHEGSAFDFEQTLINQEIWLPSYVEAHLIARLLFKGVREDEIIHYSDYKKFRVETVAEPERGKVKSR